MNQKYVTLAGRIGLGATLILSLLVMNLAISPPENQMAAVNLPSQVQAKNPNTAWLTAEEAVEQGVVPPHGQILELKMSYDVEGLPALSVVDAERKNGYTPDEALNEGPLTVAIFDNKDKTLYEMPFAIPNEVHTPPLDPGDAGNAPSRKTVNVSKIDFVLTLPWYSRADEVVIFDQDGIELSSYDVRGVPFTNNKPDFQTLPGNTRSDNKTSLIFGTLKDLLTQTAQAQTNGPDTVDILIMGDDYAQSDMTRFYSDIDKITSGFLSYEPYKTRASQIQFHNIENFEDLGCFYNGRLLECNISKVRSVANDHGAPYDTIFVVVNNSTYGGAGYLSGVATGYNGTYIKEMFVHESAHSFSQVVDEYLLFPTNGAVTNTAPYNCLQGAPPASEWADNVVDYNLECNYANWYRSSADSIMRHIDTRYLNDVSIEVVNNRIDAVAGPYIDDQTPPSVVLTSPQNGTTVTDTVQFAANASDNLGVTGVEFAVNGVVVGSDGSSPYTYNWASNGVADGSYTITAIAHDIGDNSTVSSAVTIKVDNVTDTTAPVIGTVSPANGSTVSSTVALTANATDNSGTVARVITSVDGVTVSNDTSAPFTHNLDTTQYANGAHEVTFTAFDLSGNRSSKTISLNFTNVGDTEAPSVTINQPFNGTITNNKGSLSVQTSANDNYAIASIEIQLDGESVATCTNVTTCDTSITKRKMTAGSHTITAIATDTSNNRSVVSVQFTIDAGSSGGNTGGKGRKK